MHSIIKMSNTDDGYTFMTLLGFRFQLLCWLQNSMERMNDIFFMGFNNSNKLMLVFIQKIVKFLFMNVWPIFTLELLC